jgi:hypothetical protein
MARIWGMDEAGYGPNLGPLVVALTCWEVPNLDFDFWSNLSGSICPNGTNDHTRLHIADSKAVHNSANGLGPLELSAWSLLQLARYAPNDVRAMVSCGHELPVAFSTNHDGVSLKIEYSPPVEADGELIRSLTAQLRGDLDRLNVTCVGIWADIIWPSRFNELVETFGNKSNVLTHLSLRLLGSQWSTAHQPRQLVLADRHGGRKFYSAALQELLGESGFVSVLRETKERSRYRVQSTEIEFAEKSERHFAVAAASLAAKYLRELAMLEFNAFWAHHQPGVRPTKGYPEDGRRYFEEIRPTLGRLRIPFHSVWRER